MQQEYSFKVGAHQYKARRLDALTSFHIASKAAPVIIFLGAQKRSPAENSGKFRENPQELPSPTPENFAKAIVTMSGAMQDGDRDYMVKACLAAVSRKMSGDVGWAPVAGTDGSLMQPLSLMEMMQIVWHVLDFNGLPDFFSEAPAEASAPKQGASSRSE